MTKPLPFTMLAIARAIEGVRKAGLPVTATSVNVVDGTITIHHQEIPLPSSLATVSTEGSDDWKDA